MTACSSQTPAPPRPARPSPAPLRLNLGSGQNPVPGYVNVDKYGSPDVVWDLEQFPWPWGDSTVDEIYLTHVLEHLGATTAVYVGVIKELYRVCRPGASIVITVPHPRHDDFLNDPTHVRVVTVEGLNLFSRTMNRQWAEARLANSPLGLYYGVDLEVTHVLIDLDEPWAARVRSGEVTNPQVLEAARQFNNVIKQMRITVKVVKAE